MLYPVCPAGWQADKTVIFFFYFSPFLPVLLTVCLWGSFPVIWQLFQAFCCEECFYLALKCINIRKKKCLLDVIGPSLLRSSLYNLDGNNLYVSDAFDLKVSIFPFSAVLFRSACRYIFCIQMFCIGLWILTTLTCQAPSFSVFFPFSAGCDIKSNRTRHIKQTKNDIGATSNACKTYWTSDNNRKK